MRDTMTARECADSLGLSLDRFNRRRDDLIARDGMPASTLSIGRYRPDRASWMAWRGRYHPGRPTLAPANDAEPLPAPHGDAWRNHLAKVYP